MIRQSLQQLRCLCDQPGRFWQGHRVELAASPGLFGLMPEITISTRMLQTLRRTAGNNICARLLQHSCSCSHQPIILPY
jgi:hypothetical protein